MDHNKAFVQSIVDRMKTVLGFSKDKELAEYLGGSRSTTAAWKLRGTIPINECIELAVKHGVSLDWLILGGGPGPSTQTAELIAQEGVSVELDQSLYVDVPLFDMATFSDEGGPTVSWKLPRAWIEAEGLSIDDTIIVRAVGDPMAETIVDGQMVLVDRRPRDSDGVFLVRIGGAMRFKRLQRMVDGSLRLSTDNPAYAVEVVPPDSEMKPDIIGYVHATVLRVR